MVLDNFVEINIVKRPYIPVGTYDTAVYVKQGGTNKYYALGGLGTGTSKEDAATPNATDLNDKYIATFFDNGGKYLHVLPASSWDENTVNNVPLEEIVFFTNATIATTYWRNDRTTNPLKGIHQKLFLKATTDTDVHADGLGVAYKYAAGNHPENVAAIAAYYTKINVDDARTIKDYAFTAEKVADNSLAADDKVTNIINHCLNADIYLAGAIRNIGGSYAIKSTGSGTAATVTESESITNFVMRVILQQTVANALINLLCKKITYDLNGITAVKATIGDQLLRYVNNGYITTDKIWQDDDMYLDGELIVAKNTTLSAGYAIHVAPATPEMLAKHQFPPVYILYADAVAIRKIVINGEVY